MVCWGSASLVGWTDDKLQHMVKLIVGDEQFDDIGNGTDGGLFDIFPYLHDRITIREVLNCARFLQSLQDTDKRDNGSVCAIVSWVDTKVELETGEYIRRLQEGDEESEESEDVDTEDSSDVQEVSEEEVNRKRDRRHEDGGKKKRKIIVISDSD